MKKLAYNLKLQWRMTLLISLTGLVILAAVSVASYLTAAKIVRARIQSELLAQSSVIANELDTYFNRISEIPTLTAQINATLIGKLDYSDRVMEYTHSILETDPDIQDIYSGYEKGVVNGKDYALMTWKYDSSERKNIIKGTYNFPGDPNYDSSKKLYEYHTDESWYVLAQKAGKTVWGSPYYDAGGANQVITSVVSPIIKDGKFLGVAGVDVPLTRLNEIISQYKMGKTGYAIVIDSQTHFVADPNHSDYVEQGVSLADLAESTKAKMVEDAVKNIQAGKAGFTEGYNPVAKTDQMAFYSPIESTGWWVVVMVPTQEMMGEVNSIAIQSAVITLLGILLLCGITALISRSIVNPLKTVNHGAFRISRGIVSVDPKDVESYRHLLLRGDELGEVGRSFQDLIGYFSEMTDVAHAIAHGDLTQTVTPKSSEDGLGNAFAEMIAGLRELVGGVTDNATTLQESAQMMAASAEQSGQATTQIAATIQQVAKGIGQQSESITATAASVSEMGRAIDGVSKGAQDQAEAVTRASTVTTQLSSAILEVTENAERQAKGANETAQAAQNSASTVDATVQGMQRIQDKVALSAQKVQEMGTRSAQIGVIVETIDDIASQTNMLALNAAIEAARAGEHGKGFAVVADEVRKLAEKSASAAKEIAGLVKGIQTTVNEAVGAMDDGAREVETGVSLVEQSGQVFNEILQAAENGKMAGAAIVNAAKHMNQLSTELVEAMDAVSAVVEQNTTVTQMMTEDANEVTRAVENIAAVSEENSAAVEQVSASTEEMSAQVEEVTASAQTLVELAQMLRQMAGQFQLEK